MTQMRLDYIAGVTFSMLHLNPIDDSKDEASDCMSTFIISEGKGKRSPLMFLLVQVVVFNIATPGNISRALLGDPDIGTIVFSAATQNEQSQVLQKS